MFGYPAEARDGADPAVRRARASSIRRRARPSSSASQPKARSPTICCACGGVDNSPVWVEVTAHADPPAADGSVRIDALVRDVSERKKLEDQTRDLYHQLLQAEKLAALGQTISGVAHELNNPLATILTWAERLSQRPQCDEKTKARPRDDPQRVGARREDRAQPAHLRAQAAVDALDGRPEPGRPRDAGAALLRAAHHQHHRRRCARRRACRTVFADAHQVQQVLLNLIINAEQAMLARQRPRHARGPQLARRGARSGRPRDQRRWPRHRRRAAAEDLRPVFHDEGGRQGHRPRPDRGLRDRAGARRPHPPRLEPRLGRVVLCRAACQRHAAAARAAPAHARPTSSRSGRIDGACRRRRAGAGRRGQRSARRRRLRGRSRRRRRGSASARRARSPTT